MTLKSLANQFNLERAKKYGSCHQPLPSKFKIKTSNHFNNVNSKVNTGLNKSNNSPTSSNTSSSSYTTVSTFSGSVPSIRSSKIKPQLNPNARKMNSKSKRCKASVLLDQIPVCKLQKTLIKYGCCHNMNVISLDFYEYPKNEENNCC